MSLLLDEGLPLPPPPPALDDPGCQVPDQQRIPQDDDTWCWAATLASALRTLGKPGDQGEIVARKRRLPAGACSGTGIHPDCKARLDWSELKCLWRAEGFGGAAFERRRLDFSELTKEVCAGRPVLLELGNKHVILAYGWDVVGGTERVWLVDTFGDDPPRHWNFKDLDVYLDWPPWAGTCFNLAYDGSTDCQ